MYAAVPLLGLAFVLWYISAATCGAAYSDYIRQILSYLPDVWNPEKFFVPDILTRIPINFPVRAFNVSVLGFSVTFDLVMGCELSGGLDTKIEVMEEVLRQLGVTTPEARAATVMVGDRKYDMEGARHCGVRAVGVGFGYAPPGELEGAGADVILPTVEALADYLLEN